MVRRRNPSFDFSHDVAHSAIKVRKNTVKAARIRDVLRDSEDPFRNIDEA